LPVRVSTGENSAPWQGTHNIFIERLWRSLKYEEIFLKAYGSPAEARRGIGAWLSFYNDERPHQTHGYRTPREVFTGVTHGYVDNVSS
jgi:putative transposase